MPENENTDPFSSVAQTGPQDFELRGGDSVVSLHFDPDATYIMQCLLYSRGGVSATTVGHSSGFEDVCVVTPPRRHSGYNRYYDPMVNHARTTLGALAFTFNSLGSTLIETHEKQGSRTIYNRNRQYAVLDERPSEDRSD